MKPPAATKTPLTEIERTRFSELEPIIQDGMTNFIVVGQALIEISNSRLYRDDYSTFKEYVETKWEISVSRAYQLCEAAEVVKSLPVSTNGGDKLNERQARELAKVPRKKRARVLEAAVEKAEEQGQHVTADGIKEEAEKASPKKTSDQEWKEATANLKLTPETTPLSAFTRLIDDAMSVIPGDESPVLPYRRILEDRAAKLFNRDQQTKQKTAYA